MRNFIKIGFFSLFLIFFYPLKAQENAHENHELSSANQHVDTQKEKTPDRVQSGRYD